MYILYVLIKEARQLDRILVETFRSLFIREIGLWLPASSGFLSVLSMTVMQAVLSWVSRVLPWALTLKRFVRLGCLQRPYSRGWKGHLDRG